MKVEFKIPVNLFYPERTAEKAIIAKGVKNEMTNNGRRKNVNGRIGFHFDKGRVYDVDDKLTEGWFFKALVETGKVTLLSSSEKFLKKANSAKQKDLFDKK